MKRKKAQVVEPDLGAWERFEHAVDAAVKGGPKHRTPTGKIVPPQPRKPLGGSTKKPTQKRESTKTKR